MTANSRDPSGSCRFTAGEPRSKRRSSDPDAGGEGADQLLHLGIAGRDRRELGAGAVGVADEHPVGSR